MHTAANSNIVINNKNAKNQTMNILLSDFVVVEDKFVSVVVESLFWVSISDKTFGSGIWSKIAITTATITPTIMLTRPAVRTTKYGNSKTGISLAMPTNMRITVIVVVIQLTGP